MIGTNGPVNFLPAWTNFVVFNCQIDLPVKFVDASSMGNFDYYEDNMICEEVSDYLFPYVIEIDKKKTSLRTNLT